MHPSASIDIAAPLSIVAGILLDLKSYTQWCPFTIAMRGELHPGETIMETVALTPGATSLRLQPVVVREVTQGETHCKTVWESIMWTRAVLHAVRVQQLTATPDGGTHYTTTDRMSGLLAPLVLGLYGKCVQDGFVAIAAALKERAEAQHARVGAGEPQGRGISDPAELGEGRLGD